MAKIILNLAFYLLYTLVGMLWIGFAVINFKEQKYFRFGFDVMMAIFEAFCMAELVFMT